MKTKIDPKIRPLLSSLPFALFSLIGLTSCTSYFIKKDCEKQNWYQVGYDAALRGERISNDDKVTKCRKVEAEISESQLDLGFKSGMGRYCQPEGAYQTGRAGDSFNTEFCESQSLPLLTRKHQEGINAYCENGLSAGTSGKKYKNVCPPGLEKSFLPEYKKGRKKYLSGIVTMNEEKLTQLERENLTYQQSKVLLQSRLMFLPNPAAGQVDSYAKERSNLNTEISQTDSRIYSNQASSTKLRNENSLLKQEILTLD